MFELMKADVARLGLGLYPELEGRGMTQELFGIVHRWTVQEPRDRKGHRNGAVYRELRLAAVCPGCDRLLEERYGRSRHIVKGGCR